MPQEKFAVCGESLLVAVVDVAQVRALRQALRQRTAQLCELVRLRAFDADQQHTRDDAFAQLINQNLLRSRRRARQECTHVRRVVRARRDPSAQDQERKP
jgi:hypothetical protein